MGVERVEVKDVRVPEQLQRAMAAEAEHKASRALKHAAEIINDSPAALQLRYLQTLNNISAENNSTVIFPVPIDLISNMVSHTAQKRFYPFLSENQNNSSLMPQVHSQPTSNITQA